MCIPVTTSSKSMAVKAPAQGGAAYFWTPGTSVDVGGGIHDSLVALNSNGWATGGGISISGGVGKTVTVSYYPAHSFLSNSRYREFAVHHPEALERRVV